MQASAKDWIGLATRFRYALPVLAELERDQGCKFITLVRRLGASDRAIRQALDHLMELGWVQPNPGYGHPSRPEYVVANESQAISAKCLDAWDELLHWRQPQIALERWPLPMLIALTNGHSRFQELKSTSSALTPRALSIALDRLISAGLVERRVVFAHPPSTEYFATNWGVSVAHLLA